VPVTVIWRSHVDENYPSWAWLKPHRHLLKAPKNENEMGLDKIKFLHMG
jgi:hypothetical protein